MTRREDWVKAITFRKQGWTYSEIKRKLNISKSTLSGWLGKYPLTETELKRLEKRIKGRMEEGYKKMCIQMERIRNTKAEKRQKRLDGTYKDEKERLLPLTDRELYLCGLFLYWGEGTKGLRTSLGLCNTDPKVMKFYLHWLVKILKIPKRQLRVYIHLYDDMNCEKTLSYWSRELGIPISQFIKPYVKKSKRSDLTHKGHGKGTCGLIVHDRTLKERLMLGLDAIADYYSEFRENLI